MLCYTKLWENGKSRKKYFLYFKYKIHVLYFVTFSGTSILYFILIHLFEGYFVSKYILMYFCPSLPVPGDMNWRVVFVCFCVLYVMFAIVVNSLGASPFIKWEVPCASVFGHFGQYLKTHRIFCTITLKIWNTLNERRDSLFYQEKTRLFVTCSILDLSEVE